MTTRLELYNGALLELGARELASLAEEREPRRLLDRAWNGGAVDFCLSTGQWRFATRATQLAPQASVDPQFGYRHAYERPADLIRTVGVYSDEYNNVPHLDYRTEQRYVFADIEPLYLSYVSNHETYGGDLSLWPQEFKELVQLHLASKIVGRLTQDKAEWDRVYRLYKMALRDAAARAAMEGPTVFPPEGNWVNARRGRSSGRYDRGSRSRLIG